MEQVRGHIGNLTRKAVLRFDNQVHLTFHAEEKQRVLQAITPL